MIVNEENWDGEQYTEFKDTIVRELFDKIGIALSTKLRTNVSEFTEEYCDSMSEKVDSYFYKMKAKDGSMALLLPRRLRDCNKFYVFTIRGLSTGGILLTFVALLEGKVHPCELQMIY